jgi:hypothetical protein
MTYIFYRDRHFYPVDGITNDSECAKHIALNPGTTKVETMDGRLVWKHGDPLPKFPKH